jgi:hypothetical protein
VSVCVGLVTENTDWTSDEPLLLPLLDDEDVELPIAPAAMVNQCYGCCHGHGQSNKSNKAIVIVDQKKTKRKATQKRAQLTVSFVSNLIL